MSFGDKVPQHIRDAWPDNDTEPQPESPYSTAGFSEAEAWWAGCFPQHTKTESQDSEPHVHKVIEAHLPLSGDDPNA